MPLNHDMYGTVPTSIFLSSYLFRLSAISAVSILAATVPHQIIICPPKIGGRIRTKPENEDDYYEIVFSVFSFLRDEKESLKLIFDSHLGDIYL